MRVPGGERPIESFSVGDPILSIDEKTGEAVAARVARVIDHGEAATLLIRLEDGRSLVATGAHPLYDVGSGAYRQAGLLKPGDRLAVAVSGKLNSVRIVSID